MEVLKQTDEPSFPKVLWSRPLNRAGAGRLLLVGGHSSDFSQIQAVYQLAQAAGVGECQVALPDNLARLLADTPGSHFLPASRSGSLGKAALAGLLDLARESDAVAIGANLSANSETTILIESLLAKTDRPVILFGEAFAAFKHNLKTLTGRSKTLIVADMAEVFRLSGALGLAINFKDTGLTGKLDIMQQLAGASSADYVLQAREMIVAAQTKISLTASVSAMDFFEPATVAAAAVFWLQNPGKPFEALTSAAYVLRQARAKIAEQNDAVLTVTQMTKAIEQVMSAEDF